MFIDSSPDTLSTTLMRMKLKSSAAGAMDAGGLWAVEVPEYVGFKLHMLLKGECWVSVEGVPSTYHLKAGDCILMTSGKPYVVAKNLSVKKRVKFESLYKTVRDGVITVNGGGDYFAVGTYFQFDGHLPKITFAHLPPVIHIPGHLDKAAVLRWSLERFRTEYLEQYVGRSLVLNHLAPIILLQILRIYLSSVKGEKNWLVALSDPKLSKAIEAMHANYQKPWSLDTLASTAGLSRSGFALNFKKQIGIAPLDYLTQWRMQIACELLVKSDQNVAAIANAVGYESESAFSAAFKKVVKCRPGFYQKNPGSRPA